jgi:hypothetical protein
MSSIVEDSDGSKSGNPSHLVEHNGCTVNYTKDEWNSSVSVDLGKGRYLVPNYYCLRHGCNHGYWRLESWDFEGSNDGSSYTVLRAHRNDNSLAAQAFSVAAWKVEGVKQAYRYFRIRMTGKNSGYNNDGNSYHQLCCAGIELYGMLLSSTTWHLDTDYVGENAIEDTENELLEELNAIEELMQLEAEEAAEAAAAEEARAAVAEAGAEAAAAPRVYNIAESPFDDLEDELFGGFGGSSTPAAYLSPRN